MPFDVVARPNMVVLAGLCVLICVADVHFICRRKQPAGLVLNLQHVLLGLLNLSCSLVCACGTLVSGWKEPRNNWSSVLVGLLWVSRTEPSSFSNPSFTDGKHGRSWSLSFGCATSRSQQTAVPIMCTLISLHLLSF